MFGHLSTLWPTTFCRILVSKASAARRKPPTLALCLRHVGLMLSARWCPPGGTAGLGQHQGPTPLLGAWGTSPCLQAQPLRSHCCPMVTTCAAPRCLGCGMLPEAGPSLPAACSALPSPHRVVCHQHRQLHPAGPRRHLSGGGWQEEAQHVGTLQGKSTGATEELYFLRASPAPGANDSSPSKNRITGAKQEGCHGSARASGE